MTATDRAACLREAAGLCLAHLNGVSEGTEIALDPYQYRPWTAWTPGCTWPAPGWTVK